MKDAVVVGISKFFDSGATRSVTISIAMGILGFASHAMIQVHDQTAELARHEQAIDRLSTNADAERVTIESIHVAIERIDGKIDVLGQKIDDDRRAKHN